MKRLVLLVLPLLAAACSPPAVEVAGRLSPMTDAHALPAQLPPMKQFAAAPAPQAPRANAEIAQDFLDLAFRMESGREIKRFTRFEGPVRVSLSAAAPGILRHDLDRLIERLRREARLDIAKAAPGEAVQIVIETPTRAEIQRTVPGAACFVVPRVAGWEEFRRNRNGAALDWTTLETRERATVMIPRDVSPQEMRDCLNEEVAQALGPLNDLYELPDSVFNDDNIHGVLTGFDMLILRAYHAPELASGMTRAEVAARLPGVLARLNPAGERVAQGAHAPTPRVWIDAIEDAMSPGGSLARRRDAARSAMEIAERAGWQDNRLGFALYAEGRLLLGSDPGAAVASFKRAFEVYRARYGEDSIHAALLSVQLAAYHLSDGKADAVLAVTGRAIPAARRAENAALLATLLMLRAEALDLAGRGGEAEAVRLDSLGWAQYGFGSAQAVHARMAEIAALAPRRMSKGN